MSGYEIPFHIQEEIMKRLPVKSLVRFRCVSKEWKSLIDSSHFIAAHSYLSHTQPQHLLVSYEYPGEELKCVCFEDDDTFPQHRFILTLPLSVKQLVKLNILGVVQKKNLNIVGVSHGLVCFYCPDTNLAVISNPSIKKSIDVDVPKYSSVGFGVCPVTTDPKIVAVTQFWDESNIETSYECEVMVYTLSSGKWRSLSTNLPTKPLRHSYEVVAADGFIYWLGGLPGDDMMMSFDLTKETFQMIDLPTTLACHDPKILHIHKLRESLAILQYDGSTYTIWKMEGGVQRSFTKLFTIHAPVNPLLGFRRSGVPIVLVPDDQLIKLVVYEPNSEHDNVFDISGGPFLITSDSYVETLLLLGRSDCSSY